MSTSRPTSRPTPRIVLLLACLVATFGPLATSCGVDGEDASSSSTDTTAIATTSSTSTTRPVAATPIVWPPADGSITYADPVDAASGVAVDLIGFEDPVVGEFRQGDSRSGEVEVRPRADGPVTTVLVRQVGSDESWSVIGTSTEGIVPTEPAPGATVSSPVALAGTSTAFEGTVQVEVVGRRPATVLGSGFVTGGSMGEMGPFAGEIGFESPNTDDGAVMFLTRSEEDGRVWEAAVVPVRFDRRG